MAKALVATPPFITQNPPDESQGHVPGRVASMSGSLKGQHLVIDSQTVDGLTYAWTARAALGLSADVADKIREATRSTAYGTFWRYPTIRLNQINWYARLYSASATVTGNPDLLLYDFREQLRRFVAGIGPTPSGAGNLGPGARFHYVPHQPIQDRLNLDSAEYASIVLSFARFYPQARAAGMPKPSAAELAALHRWIRRAIAGYWTHSGYPNWDTGFGFERWHQHKKRGLMQEELNDYAPLRDLRLHHRRHLPELWIAGDH